MEDIQMAQSLKFSGYSCRLSEKSASPQKRYRYICYSCGGDEIKSKSCFTCRGTKTVQSSDAMVQLFTQVLSCKLMIQSSNVNDLPEIKETLKHCSQIKQQSESPDKYIICDTCQSQLGQHNSEFMYCRECEYYYLCKKCYEEDKYYHEHQVQRYFINESEKWSSSQIDSEEQTIKVCQCCSEEIEDKGIYLSCENCKQMKVFYQICSKCSQQKRHKHQIDHIFKPSLYRAPKNRKKKNAIDSQIWLQKDKFHQSQVFVEDNQDEQEYQSFKIKNWTDSPLLTKNMPRNSEPAIKIQCSPKKKDQSQVLVPIQQTDSQPSSKMINYSKNALLEMSQKRLNRNMSSKQQKKYKKCEEDYLFDNFQCDVCNLNPVNLRYHCKECQDYDLCLKCFQENTRSHKHPHAFIEFTREMEEQRKNIKMRQLKELRKKFQDRCSQIKNALRKSTK